MPQASLCKTQKGYHLVCYLWMTSESKMLGIIENCYRQDILLQIWTTITCNEFHTAVPHDVLKLVNPNTEQFKI